MSGNRIPIESRVLVKTRDRNRCARCGAEMKDRGQWHHRRRRGVHDELTHSAANGVWLCPSCHRWAHNNPDSAADQGWIVRTWLDPREVPVTHFLYGHVLLTVEGTTIAA